MCGRIRDKYNQTGGPAGFLLFPKSNELTNPGNTGKRSEFVGGNIYWSAATDAHPVAHEFLTKWGEKGYESGYLKYPTTDEIVLPNSVNRRQEYQGGSIYWAAGIGAHTIQGAIRDKWRAMGAQDSYLGYPTSDEKVTPDGIGRYNTFQNGSIYWSPLTGAHPVSGAIMKVWAEEGYEAGQYGYPTGDPQIIDGDPKRHRQSFQGDEIMAGTLFGEGFQWTDLHIGETYTCQIEAVGDYVHISSTPPPTASGHAWFEVVTPERCPEDLRADITAQLQYTLDNGHYAYAGDVAYKLNVKPGGGSTNRANARYTCVDDEVNYWRTEIDVDIIGYEDPADKGYSFARTGECS